MKKILMGASALVMALSLNSCSSDDNGGGVSEAKLVGKWEHNTEKSTAAGQVITPEQPYSENEDGCSKDYIQFNDNGTAVFGDYWGGACDLSQDSVDWSLDGKTVTVTDGETTETYTVVSVSATKLKVKQVTTLQGVNWVDEYTFTKAAQ